MCTKFLLALRLVYLVNPLTPSCIIKTAQFCPYNQLTSLVGSFVHVRLSLHSDFFFQLEKGIVQFVLERQICRILPLEQIGNFCSQSSKIDVYVLSVVYYQYENRNI